MTTAMTCDYPKARDELVEAIDDFKQQHGQAPTRMDAPPEFEEVVRRWVPRNHAPLKTLLGIPMRLGAARFALS